MLQLRLVGIHDDGHRLLLSGPDGVQFAMPVDEALRSAVHRAGRAPGAGDGAPAKISPRDIQARIRSGATAEMVSEEFGIPLANVKRYEGPVLAERDHIVRLAQGVEVGTSSDIADPFHAGFQEEPITLNDMIEHRLQSLGINPENVTWDSRKTGSTLWEVSADFEVPDQQAQLGETPPARWTYNTSVRTLTNLNRWAQHISEASPAVDHEDTPLGNRHLSTVKDRPFNFETDAPPTGPVQISPSESLIDLLNSRRGQRLGVDEDAEDALAELLSQGIPAAHPRHEDEPEHEHEPSDEDSPSVAGGLRMALPHDHLPQEESHLQLSDGVSHETREIRMVPGSAAERRQRLSLAEELFSQSRTRDDERAEARERGEEESSVAATERKAERTDVAEKADSEPERAENSEHTEAKAPEPKAAKRRSVPSWDEIMFGTKGDN